VGVSAVASTIGLGDETLITNNNLSVSGFGVTVSQGSVVTESKAIIYPVGVEGEGLTKSVQVWSLINTSQTPNYTIISGNQTPNYAIISGNQTPDWEEVA
jgi:hypothetical protein